MYLTDDEVEEMMDRETEKLIASGVIKVDDFNYKGYLDKLSKAKNSNDLNNILEKLNPYDYRVIKGISPSHEFLGLVVHIKQTVETKTIRIPRDPQDVLDIQMDGNTTSGFTIINKEIKE